MAGPLLVGLDVGGTQVKGGALAVEELQTLQPAQARERVRSVDTHLDQGAEAFFESLADFARELAGGVAPAAVGLGCPGVFEADGILERSANLAVLAGADLTGELARRLDLERARVAVGNDADLAAYGEQWLGAGRGVDDLVMLTLGTGIGGGVLLGGRLFNGPTGKGAEVGHMIVRARRADEPEEPGLRCGCGAYGCLERLASATAAERRARAAGLEPDLERLAAAARRGPGPERALLEAVGRDLGAGLLSVTSLLGVNTFVIGGGFGAALDVLLPGVLACMGERDYGLGPPRLLPAELGGAAGWIGAARRAADALGLAVAAS